MDGHLKLGKGMCLNLIELLKAILYGIVEGITEWLPISSTGHMLLLQRVMPLAVTADFWDMFLVVIQLGAILAVCVLFFGRLNPFSRHKDAAGRRGTWALWAKIVVATIPAAIIGLPLNDWIDEHLQSSPVIAAALIVYGAAFIVIETVRSRPRHAVGAHAVQTVADDDRARVRDMTELGFPTAIGIGIFQVLSLVPGTSRSGSTIIGGLILGCSRPVAAEFTFFLAIPTMFGASALKLVKFCAGGNGFSSYEGSILTAGCIVAFLVSLLAIRFLMGFVKRHDFRPFGVYRIILGVAVIAAMQLA